MRARRWGGWQWGRRDRDARKEAESGEGGERRAEKKGLRLCWNPSALFWSERLDSNQRPPGPKPGALPSCATLRYGSRRPEGGVSFQKANLFRDNAEVVAAVLRPHGGTGAFNGGTFLTEGDHFHLVGVHAEHDEVFVSGASTTFAEGEVVFLVPRASQLPSMRTRMLG